jgi:hypothetical protein
MMVTTTSSKKDQLVPGLQLRACGAIPKKGTIVLAVALPTAPHNEDSVLIPASRLLRGCGIIGLSKGTLSWMR